MNEWKRKTNTFLLKMPEFGFLWELTLQYWQWVPVFEWPETRVVKIVIKASLFFLSCSISLHSRIPALFQGSWARATWWRCASGTRHLNAPQEQSVPPPVSQVMASFTRQLGKGKLLFHLNFVSSLSLAAFALGMSPLSSLDLNFLRAVCVPVLISPQGILLPVFMLWKKKKVTL